MSNSQGEHSLLSCALFFVLANEIVRWLHCIDSFEVAIIRLVKQITHIIMAVLSLWLAAGCSQQEPVQLAPTLLAEPQQPPNEVVPAEAVESHQASESELQPVSPTEVPPVSCSETEGQIITTSFQSSIMGSDVRYRIYLPPCYDQTNVEYPYIIMMHGFDFPGGMDDSMWDEIGLDETADTGYSDGTLPPMIIVMPNGNDAQHDYDPGPYPQVLVDELIPHIESEYCAWGTPATRGIGGLSRGGYWAVATAFLYPDLFEHVGGHSAFFYDGEYPQANPSALITSAPGIENLAIYLDHGSTDSIVDDNMRVFVERANARGINPIYITDRPGGHTNEYWASQSSDYLAFYSEDWPRSIEDYPPCE